VPGTSDNRRLAGHLQTLRVIVSAMRPVRLLDRERHDPGKSVHISKAGIPASVQKLFLIIMVWGSPRVQCILYPTSSTVGWVGGLFTARTRFPTYHAC